MRWVEILLEILGWVTICASVIIISALLALTLIYFWKNERANTIGWIMIACGIVSGIVIATIIWKRQGTVSWLSRIRRIS
ncbi:MAG TPA: hypothetical protein VF145_01040 [Chitinophagaceae bacterium]